MEINPIPIITRKIPKNRRKVGISLNMNIAIIAAKNGEDVIIAELFAAPRRSIETNINHQPIPITTIWHLLRTEMCLSSNHIE